jgi:hypothetical protein
MKLYLPIFIAVLIFSPLFNRQVHAEDKAMIIKLSFKDHKDVFAILDNNQAAQDFMAQLPLTLDMRDFAGTEKASDKLPKSLSIPEASKGHEPAPGDLAYFVPWGNLAIYYKNAEHHSGLVKIGQIKGDPFVFNVPGQIKLKIEKVENE